MSSDHPFLLALQLSLLLRAQVRAHREQVRSDGVVEIQPYCSNFHGVCTGGLGEAKCQSSLCMFTHSFLFFIFLQLLLSIYFTKYISCTSSAVLVEWHLCQYQLFYPLPDCPALASHNPLWQWFPTVSAFDPLKPTYCKFSDQGCSYHRGHWGQ